MEGKLSPAYKSAFAQIIAETIFPKRAATRAGTASPFGAQKLEQVLEYFDPSQLLFKILHKDRDGTPVDQYYHMVEG